MHAVKVLKPFKRRGEVVSPGSIIEVPDHILPKLTGLVEVVPRHRKAQLSDWRPEPRAWIQDGELRTVGVFRDLAAEIVKLTPNDIGLQRHLLIEHCQRYSPTHLSSLVPLWGAHAAMLEHDAEMDRAEAEREAAEFFHLTAWLSEIRTKGHQNERRSKNAST